MGASFRNGTQCSTRERKGENLSARLGSVTESSMQDFQKASVRMQEEETWEMGKEEPEKPEKELMSSE